MVKDSSYVPARGDIVWIDFDPQAGREQAGRRPALVLSPHSYNGKTGLALMAPVTNRKKGYPFECELPEELVVAGVVLADHTKNLDWRTRRAEFACACPVGVVAEVRAKLNALLG